MRRCRVLLLNNDAVAAPALADWVCAPRRRDRFRPRRRPRAQARRGAGRHAAISIRSASRSTAACSRRTDWSNAIRSSARPAAARHSARRVLEAAARRARRRVRRGFLLATPKTRGVAARRCCSASTPRYTDDVLAWHEGQASSGGGFNDFVLYHGIRNSILDGGQVRAGDGSADAPAVAGRAARRRDAALQPARQVARGAAGCIDDALFGLARMWKKRRRIQKSRRIGARAFGARIGARFYDHGYFARTRCASFEARRPTRRRRRTRPAPIRRRSGAPARTERLRPCSWPRLLSGAASKPLRASARRLLCAPSAWFASRLGLGLAAARSDRARRVCAATGAGAAFGAAARRVAPAASGRAGPAADRVEAACGIGDYTRAVRSPSRRWSRGGCWYREAARAERRRSVRCA